MTTYEDQIEMFCEYFETNRDKLKCPECGKYSMYNRNASVDPLWYCPNCEERFTQDELMDMFTQNERDVY